MPTTAANMLDLSPLPAVKRREIRDFYQFLLARRGKGEIASAATPELTCHHFADLCGTLSWKGEAVAAQRSLRDEW